MKLMKNITFIAAITCLLLGACQPKVIDVSDTIKTSKLKICTTQIEGKSLYGIRHVDKGVIIPIIFDKIDDDINLFICTKDGLISVYNILGELLAEDVVEVKLEYAIPTYTRFDGGFQNKYYRLRMQNDSVYILMHFGTALTATTSAYSPLYKYGPFQDFEIGINGFFFKKNGKWGYNLLKNKKEKSFLKPQFDHILEVFDSYLCYYFLCDINNKWKVYDIRGVEITDYPSAVNKRLLQSEKAETFRCVGDLWKYKSGMIRSGDGPVGIATFDEYKFDTDYRCHIRYQERIRAENQD